MQATLYVPIRPRLQLFLAAAAIAGAAACGETSVSAPIPPGSITAVGGTTRTGVAGRPLAELVEVVVRGTDNQPLPGVQVTFTPTGQGAAVDPASATTDAAGVARTRWTLPSTAGDAALTVTAGSATAQLTATTTPGPASAASPQAGENQAGVAGGVVATPPAVRVVDAFGNPVAGASVTFSTVSAGGTVVEPVQLTNGQGVATVGGWILGPTPGTQTLIGRVEAAGVTGSPVVFTANVAPAAAAAVAAASATSQTAGAGTRVGTLPSVRVTDAFGNPVPGVQVTFAVTGGGGQVTGATQTTNAQGIATVGDWTLGANVGANQLSATVAGLGTVNFAATGVAGAATQLSIAAGNNQTAGINRAVPVPPRVVVRDASGNPVAGVVVTFGVASGGGQVISPRQTTDAAGIAEVGAWILGTTPGANTLSASAPGLTPVTFTATASAGQPVSMQPASATTQGGTVGGFVAAPPSVVVRDIGGNPVPGVAVTFTVSAGAGALQATAGGAELASVSVTTNATGTATVAAWRLGNSVVTNTVVASATGLPSVTFTATPAAGAPASVVPIAGTDAVAVQGQPVIARPTVRVLDAGGNFVAGARVFFSVASGSGAVTGATQTTDATGSATVGTWVLGAGAPNSLLATVIDTLGNALVIPGNPVTFTARSATNITSAAPATASLGTPFTITAQLKDALGDNVSLGGVPLTISIASGGGTLTGTTTVTTNSAGLATFTLTVTGSAGGRTFTISGAGLVSATTGTVTFN